MTIEYPFKPVEAHACAQYAGMYCVSQTWTKGIGTTEIWKKLEFPNAYLPELETSPLDNIAKLYPQKQCNR